jgi:hypothetical protein
MRSASKFTPSALEIGFPKITGSIRALAKTRRSIVAATCGITEAVTACTSIRTRRVFARTQPRPRISTRVRACRCAADVRHPLIVGCVENARMRRRSKFSISHVESGRHQDGPFRSRPCALGRSIANGIPLKQSIGGERTRRAQRARTRVRNHARSALAHARSLHAARVCVTTPRPPSPRHARCNV